MLERNPCVEEAALADDTPLLESRLVTSLQITDLLVLIESLRHAPIDIQQLRPGAFRDIATIHHTFFESARS